MTPEEKLQKARDARLKAAQKRSDAAEKQQVAEVRAMWDYIPQEQRRIFEYIEQQIASGTRSLSDVLFLRETRALHLAPLKRAIKKEDPDAR